MSKQTFRWYYRMPGSFDAYGPTSERYADKRELRKAVGRFLEAWPASDVSTVFHRLPEIGEGQNIYAQKGPRAYLEA